VAVGFAAAAGASAAAALRAVGRAMNVLKHWLLPRAALARRFPSHALSAIEAAIQSSETRHRAEIRVALETSLELAALLRLKTPRERALEVFGELRVWDTVERNGVLIYVLLAEHAVEIVADRGFTNRVAADEWERVCEIIDRAYADERWRDGTVAGIEAATALLTREFPAGGPNVNEQPNRPSIV
jgi:uncharacterized membrane protein